MAANASKDKGTRAETLVKSTLKQLTGLAFERTPLSGALDAKHGLKSDIYVPMEKNLYAIEVKHYEECHIDHSLISGKSPQLITWWTQTKRQAIENKSKPLLIFKHDRSKLYVAFEDLPEGDYPFIFISKDGHEFYISLLELFILFNKPKFIA